MLPQPKPPGSKTSTKHFRPASTIESASETIAKDGEVLKELDEKRHRQIKQRMVMAPRSPVLSGSLKRKAGSDASQMPASGTMVQHTTINGEDDSRKRPHVKAYFKSPA
jgi:hypothetical protein